MSTRQAFNNFPVVRISEEVEEQLAWISENANEDQDAGVKFVLVAVSTLSGNDETLTKLVFSAMLHAGHSENLSECRNKAMKQQLTAGVHGGGKFFIDHDTKAIYLWGRSEDYGKADHLKAAEVLRTKYLDYQFGVEMQKPIKGCY